MKLVFATRNRGKLVELQALMALVPEAARPQVVGLDEAGVTTELIEDGATFADNAARKAEAARDLTGLAALADDSGLEVDALGGAPGVDSAIYAGLPSGAPGADAANNERLVRELTGATAPLSARYRCVLALAVPGEPTVFEEGTIEGEILLEPRGEGGFGYDPHFLVVALDRTMAELSLEEKNRISHRGLAMRRMVERLARRPQDEGGVSR